MSEQMQSATMTEREALARRFFEDVFSEGRLEVIDEITSDDYQAHDPQDRFADLRGPAASRAVVKLYRNAFPDLRFTIEDVVEQRDRVVVRWTATGTHQGELLGLAPTGKSATVTGITIWRMAGGRVVEGWTSWDTLGLMQQIGAAPAPGGVAEKLGVRFQRAAIAVERKVRSR